MKKMLNAHISKPTCTIEEWMQKQHSAEEIAQRLRLVGKAHKAFFSYAILFLKTIRTNIVLFAHN